MKNFTKLFVVAVALFAFSCATDTTEDLGVNISNQTTITLSLEESRTQFGEKADGVYPLYWSKGDQISINGITSKALTEGGSANATFTFDGTLSNPYCVVYPASERNEVTFPASQSYTAGTFCAGTAPMYGYAESASNTIQMQHLTGVLRFAVKGEATLSSIVLESESGNLAGSYTVDCATGELTAVSTSNNVTLTFGEGLALGNEATPIYIAVPAGTYGLVSATIYATTGEKMVVKFDTTAKSIAAGKVREFGEFEYSGVLSDEVLIDSVDALVKFAAAPSKDARVTANLDLTGVEWTPIEGFAHTFDGGNYEIKGLTAPLFGATSGSFKNVKLVDINIVETANPTVGALARTIITTNAEALSVSNCSVSGKLTVNVTSFAPTSEGLLTDVASSALVGYAKGVTISNCVNEATIDIQSVVSTSTTVATTASVGGIVGCIENDTALSIASVIEDCENKGAVNYANGSYSANFQITPNVGGVIGNATAGVVAKNLTNRGAIVASGTHSGEVKNCFAGVLGNGIAMTIESSTNHATISLASGRFGSTYLGGVAGNIEDCAASKCHNYGAISTAKGVKHHDLLCGGIFGGHEGNTDISFSVVDNCSNNAPVTILSDMEAVASNEMFHVGGAIGWSQNPNHHITNNKKGVVTINSNLYNAESLSFFITISACIGYQTQNAITDITNHGDLIIDATLSTSSNYTDYGTVRINAGGAIGFFSASKQEFTNIRNTGNVTIHCKSAGDIRVGACTGQCTAGSKISKLENSGTLTIKEGTTAGAIVDLGGLMPATAIALTDSVNSGHIIVEAGVTSTTNVNIGGCVGWSNASLSELTNSGNISITNAKSGKMCQVAGVVGYADGTAELTTLSNSGNITVTGGESGIAMATADDNSISNIAGCVGIVAAKKTVDGLTNSGAISISGFKSGFSMFVSGNVGRFASNIGGTLKNASNSGSIVVDEKNTIGAGLFVGGCLGHANKDSSGSVTDCENTGNITLKPFVSTQIVVGGVGGVIDLNSNSASNERMVNRGKITVDFKDMVESKNFFVGGVVGQMLDHSRDLHNYGDIEAHGVIKTNARFAGVIGYVNNYNRRSISNSGNITINAHITGTCKVGGICSGGTSNVYHDTHSSGKIHISSKAKIEGGSYIGGLFGENTSASLAINKCSSSTEILYEAENGVADNSAELCIGGMIGKATKLGSVQRDFTNSGNITFNGKQLGSGPVAVGGIFGHSDIPLTADVAIYDDKGSKGSTVTGACVYYNCKVTNTGDISCRGTYTGEAYAGGWVGKSSTAVSNGVVLCNVEAIKYPYAGVVMGTHYAEANKVTDFQIGGTICTNANWGEDPETAEEALIREIKTLNTNNFYRYIYGDNSISADQATTDGCSYISKIE